MKYSLILHGTNSSPNDNWFMWLEEFLIRSGYRVWLPQLPDPAMPNAKKYHDFILRNKNFVFNSETLLIGHSSGAVEILSLLQRLPIGTTVGNVYLVSAFKDTLGWDVLDGLFIEPFNFELIKTKARSITFIHSDNDPYVPLEHARHLTSHLNARLLIIPGQGHFNLEQSEDYRQFPLLAQVIETNDILNMEDKLTSFRGEAVEFVEAQSVKDNVECDVYSFVNDKTRDLGIIRIKHGLETPKQQILKGNKTVEGFLFGRADLVFSRANQDSVTCACSDDSYGVDTTLGIGDTMQWRADEDSVLYEICHPPYQDGRFKEL